LDKKSSTTASDAANKTKKTTVSRDPNIPALGIWDQTKFTAKDLRKLVKEDFVKQGSDEIKMPGLNATLAPPAGYRVMFLAFFYRGLSFPIHDFLRALLFAYEVQLHDLNPNTMLHIACYVTLCECFLGVGMNWALWKCIFVVRRQGPYQIGGFGCFIRTDAKYFNLKTPEKKSELEVQVVLRQRLDNG
jgi:hypothetical protein